MQKLFEYFSYFILILIQLLTIRSSSLLQSFLCLYITCNTKDLHVQLDQVCEVKLTHPSSLIPHILLQRVDLQSGQSELEIGPKVLVDVDKGA